MTMNGTWKPFRRLNPVPKSRLERPALGYLPLLRLVEAGGEFQPFPLEFFHATGRRSC